MGLGTYRSARFTWITVWVIASVLPIGPYTIPLFQGSLSNTPQAYLAWIPILAFVWAVWNLLFGQTVFGSSHRSMPLGLVLLALSGTWLTLGKHLWPVFFFRFDAAFLAWPVWALGLGWLVFGFAASRSLLRPLLYLVLVWPPIYDGILAIVNPPLESIAVSAMTAFSDSVSWIGPGPVFGVFDVATGTDTVRVYVSQACSGSDSVLALLVLFPIMLIFFRLSLLRQALLVVGGCLLAFAANLLRIFLIILALRAFGYTFAFDVLHPVLGTVMFLAVVLFILLYGTHKQLTGVQSRPSTGAGRPQFGSGTWVAVFAAVALTSLLAPLYRWVPGSPLRPVALTGRTVSTNGAVPAAASHGAARTVVHFAGKLSDLRLSKPLSPGNVRLVTPFPLQAGVGARTYVTNGGCTPGGSGASCVDTAVLLYAVQNYKRVYVRVDALTSGHSPENFAQERLEARAAVEELVSSWQQLQSSQ